MNRLDGVVAVANDYGLLQIYKSPCNTESKIQTYRGHTVHLTNVKFTCDGKKVDKSWRLGSLHYAMAYRC